MSQYFPSFASAGESVREILQNGSEYNKQKQVSQLSWEKTASDCEDWVWQPLSEPGANAAMADGKRQLSWAESASDNSYIRAITAITAYLM